MDPLKQIVLLIDADNTQLSKLEKVIQEVSAFGRIVVKRAYGNWKKDTLKKWEDAIKSLAIKPVQQFDYVSGKNATDIALTIDAMTLLHRNIYDAFAIVSSDSDFTPLAIHLRESGVQVIGIGEDKTPTSFRNSCDNFILLNTAGEKSGLNNAPLKSEKSSSAGQIKSIDEIHAYIHKAALEYQEDNGYTEASVACSYIKRIIPDFNSKNYGYPKFTDMLRDFPEFYTLREDPIPHGTPNARLVTYKCIKPVTDNLI